MTREEAIAFLCSIAGNLGFIDSENYTCKDGDKMREAIKVLNQEPCEDCISRQAVIEYIEGSEAELGHSSENELVCQYIKELPPVAQKPCDDCISRQAVLEAIRKCHCEEWIKADIGASIEALSSVTPAEKVGRWYKKPHEICYTCDHCRTTNASGVKYNFCPHCGWEKVRQEINDLFSKPACYIPNYDAYKMFLEIIDRHLQKASLTGAESEE